MAGTTHSSTKSGHGPKVRRSRFAIRDGYAALLKRERVERGERQRGTGYIKPWGSRPESKRRKVGRAA